MIYLIVDIKISQTQNARQSDNAAMVLHIRSRPAPKIIKIPSLRTPKITKPRPKPNKKAQNKSKLKIKLYSTGQINKNGYLRH